MFLTKCQSVQNYLFGWVCFQINLCKFFLKNLSGNRPRSFFPLLFFRNLNGFPFERTKIFFSSDFQIHFFHFSNYLSLFSFCFLNFFVFVFVKYTKHVGLEKNSRRKLHTIIFNYMQLPST